MKKGNMVILALSVMLASSSIIPAYAALPEGAPTDINISDSNSELNALNTWADQFTEELNKIVNPRDRYRRICELVITNWDCVSEQLGPQEAYESYLQGIIGAGQRARLLKRMCDNTGIECIAGGCLVNGYPNEVAYVRIDGVVYTQNLAALELWGMDDTYVFIDHNFNGIEIGNPFAPREQEVEVAQSTFKSISDMYTTLYIYDTDNTFYTAAMNTPMVDSCILSGNIYYKCVNATFVTITEDEAIALGYVKE